MASRGAHAKKPSEIELSKRICGNNSRSSRDEKPESARTPRHSRGKHAQKADSAHENRSAAAKKESSGGQTKSANLTSYGKQGESSADSQFSTDCLRRKHSRQNPRHPNAPKSRSGCGKKVAIATLCVLAITLIGCCAAIGLFANSIDSKLEAGKTEEEAAVVQNALAERESFTEPFYMLLLGSDSRTDDTVGSRSDTCIAVRVDPANNTVTMISIPRDTMIVYNGNTIKFNAAYAYDGTVGAIIAANELLGVEISHYAEVSFDSFADLIDAVGGVEVDVPRRISDWRAGNVTVEEGLQTLNGEAALVMARSRQYADGDFTRSSNQRLIVEALINKILSLPASEIPGVIQRASTCVSTDFSTTDIASLALQLAGNSNRLTVYSIMVPSTTEIINGASYVIADESGLAKMMEIVNAGGDPSKVKSYGATDSSLKASGKSALKKLGARY